MSDITISRDEFPSLYLSASKLSIASQKTYINLNIAQYVSLVIGSILTAISTSTTQGKFLLAVLGAFSLFATTAITIVIQFIKKEKDWYGGRAIAESIKTISWRFIMRADQYAGDRDTKIEKQFLEDIKSVGKEKKFLAGALTSELNIKPQITDKMREIRALPFNQRKEVYLQNRIKSQQIWYNDNSVINKRKEKHFFILIIGLELLTFMGAILVIIIPEQTINFPVIFTTLIGVLIAWMQLKRYQELSQSYGVASQELGMIFEESKQVKSSKDLSIFVSNSENAISREHTLWIARKSE